MEKVIRDGEVAVLVSPRYGAGWFSWNTSIPECLFCPEIVKLVEDNASAEEISSYASNKWPDGYWGGSKGLHIVWIQEGTPFEIDEYDGAESIRFVDRNWIIA